MLFFDSLRQISRFRKAVCTKGGSKLFCSNDELHIMFKHRDFHFKAEELRNLRAFEFFQLWTRLLLNQP